jgi:hypothetical protein
MILVRTFTFLNSILGFIFFIATKCEDSKLVAYDATEIGIDAVIGAPWGVRWVIPFPIIFIPKNTFGCRVEEGQINWAGSGGKECSYIDWFKPIFPLTFYKLTPQIKALIPMVKLALSPSPNVICLVCLWLLFRRSTFLVALRYLTF